MGAPRKKRASPAVLQLDSSSLERQSQLVEGRVRAYMDSHAEQMLHETARAELHRLKAQAVDTLERSMLNTGVCPRCECTGLLVDKTAVTAALGVLDRAGLPPRREVRVEDSRQVLESEMEITKRAVSALVTLEAKQIGVIVQALLQERPESRSFVVSALEAAPQLLVEAVV